MSSQIYNGMIPNLNIMLLLKDMICTGPGKVKAITFYGLLDFISAKRTNIFIWDFKILNETVKERGSERHDESLQVNASKHISHLFITYFFFKLNYCFTVTSKSCSSKFSSRRTSVTGLRSEKCIKSMQELRTFGSFCGRQLDLNQSDVHPESTFCISRCLSLES